MDKPVDTSAARVVLYSRDGCHLCARARSVLDRVTNETGEGYEEIDVDTDEALRDRYGELVPVVTVDGVQQGYWRIEADRVKAALSG